MHYLMGLVRYGHAALVIYFGARRGADYLALRMRYPEFRESLEYRAVSAEQVGGGPDGIRGLVA